VIIILVFLRRFVRTQKLNGNRLWEVTSYNKQIVKGFSTIFAQTRRDVQRKKVLIISAIVSGRLVLQQSGQVCLHLHTPLFIVDI
jgi:hypothetical protein